MRCSAKVDIPVLGVVENMSYFACPECGAKSEVFGVGGGERVAAEFGVPLLGQLPLALDIREQADGGRANRGGGRGVRHGPAVPGFGSPCSGPHLALDAASAPTISMADD